MTADRDTLIEATVRAWCGDGPSFPSDQAMAALTVDALTELIEASVREEIAARQEATCPSEVQRRYGWSATSAPVVETTRMAAAIARGSR